MHAPRASLSLSAALQKGIEKRTGAGISPCLLPVSYCFHPEQNNLQINWIGMSLGAIIILKGEGKQTWKNATTPFLVRVCESGGGMQQGRSPLEPTSPAL